MQVFRLVNGGFVDKMIAFDSLPERMLAGIKTRDISGMPRYWAKWLTDNKCTRPVLKTETEILADRNLKITKTPIGTEPCFYVLDYKDTNADKEKWQEITNYVRRVVDVKTRLLDKIEDMATKMATDSYSQLALEPEDIVVIECPLEDEKKASSDIIKETEQILTPNGVVPEKRRGRPKKVAVEA